MPGYEYLAVFLLVMVRLTAFAVSCPFFTQPSVPPMAKIGIGFTLAAIISPLVWSAAPHVAGNMFGFLMQVIVEAAVGLGMGIFTNFFFQALRIAGEVGGLHIGFAMANIVDPRSGAQTSVLANFLYVFGLVFFLAINGHHVLVMALDKSFEIIPLGGAVFTGASAQIITKDFAGVFVAALKLAAPILAVVFVIDVALGLLVRMVPQINVFMLGFPIKIMAGIFAVAVTLPLLGSLLTRLYDTMVRDLMILMKGLAG
ncbi:MAG: flagellar type III secretion system protein FliR [Peptococcaceae bacterium]|nr:flagellar type III secretion system protein FliR [Peptococcaceae bacterium]